MDPSQPNKSIVVSEPSNIQHVHHNITDDRNTTSASSSRPTVLPSAIIEAIPHPIPRFALPDPLSSVASSSSRPHVPPPICPSYTSSFRGRRPPKTPPVYVGVETYAGQNNRVFATPSGHRFYQPSVPDDVKPQRGTIYSKWQDVVNMYSNYAAESGFKTKLGQSKPCTTTNTYRFITCSRAGKSKASDYSMANNDDKKKTRKKKIDCRACVRTRIRPGSTDIELYDWIECHNHPLIGQQFADLTNKKRKLTYTDQHMLHSLKIHNIGASRAHKIQCTLKGGSEFVDGSEIDYKNFQRDIKLFISDRDATITIDTLVERTKLFPNFFFDYKVEADEVRGLFWADDISRCSFETFGDVLAFDATYKTNTYDMIFVPFTGVDHHKKCVTFGAGLICDETITSYLWLLEMFKKAHSRQPVLVLTDQDAAMRQAVVTSFPNSAHRLCMWHIMYKLPAKLKGCNVDNDELKRKLKKLIWDVLISYEEFEERWDVLMQEYSLYDHVWLRDMYAIRRRWVPCYFSHLDMCCLMKTTSRCESSNAMFKVNTSHSNTLVQFLIGFDTAIDGQRSRQRDAEYTMLSSLPTFNCDHSLERHASEVYTPTLFLEVQKEINRGFYRCSLSHTKLEGCVKLYKVAQYDRNGDIVCEFEVSFDPRKTLVSCSCMMFTRIGCLCRHIFHVLRLNQIKAIPPRYIPTRWMRNSLPQRVHDLSARYSADNRPETKIRNEIIDTVNACVDRLRRDPTQLSVLLDQLKQIKDKIFEEAPYDPKSNSKKSVISDLLRVPETSTVTFTAPTSIRTKGCGTEKGGRSNKRIVGAAEKAKEKCKKGKPLRLCDDCNEYVTNHNKRTCKKTQSQKKAAHAVAMAMAAADASAHSTSVTQVPAANTVFVSSTSIPDSSSSVEPNDCRPAATSTSSTTQQNE